jgi:hypothetical protein
VPELKRKYVRNLSVRIFATDRPATVLCEGEPTVLGEETYWLQLDEWLAGRYGVTQFEPFAYPTLDNTD